MGIAQDGKIIAYDYKGYITKALSDINKEYKAEVDALKRRVTALENRLAGYDAKIIIGSSAPSVTNAIWFDTRVISGSCPVIRFYYNGNWVPFGGALV